MTAHVIHATATTRRATETRVSTKPLNWSAAATIKLDPHYPNNLILEEYPCLTQQP